MSGGDPTARLASVFCRAPSLPPLNSSFTWIFGCVAFHVATCAVIAFASTSVYPCEIVMWTTPPRRRRLAAAAAGREDQCGDEHGRHGDDTTRA